MEDKGHKRVHPEKENYQPTAKEEVFLVKTNKIVEILKGESLDIDIDCSEGFTVFIPYPGLFHPQKGGDQIFEASEISPPDIPVKNKLWRVTLNRKNEDNPNEGHKEFPYCIYTPETENFAVASSPPKMSLDP